MAENKGNGAESQSAPAPRAALRAGPARARAARRRHRTVHPHVPLTPSWTPCRESDAWLVMMGSGPTLECAPKRMGGARRELGVRLTMWLPARVRSAAMGRGTRLFLELGCYLKDENLHNAQVGQLFA
jgi:hypothetical protein